MAAPKYLINTANTVALFSLEDPQKGYQKVKLSDGTVLPLVYPLGKNIDVSTLSVSNNLISVRDLGTRFLREVATGKFLGKVTITGYMTNPLPLVVVAPKLTDTPTNVKDADGNSILYKHTFCGGQLGLTSFVVFKHQDTDGKIKYKVRVIRNVAISSVSVEAEIDNPVKFTIDAEYGNETLDVSYGTNEPEYAVSDAGSIADLATIYDQISADDTVNSTSISTTIYTKDKSFNIYEDLSNNVYTYAYGYLYLGDDDPTNIFTGLDMNDDKKMALVSSFKANFKVDTELIFGLGERLSQGFVPKTLDIDLNLTIRQADLDKLIEFFGQDPATTTIVSTPQIRTKRYATLVLYLYNGENNGATPTGQSGATRYIKLIIKGVYPEDLNMNLKTGGEIIETELSFKAEIAEFEEVTDKLLVLDKDNETIKTV